jgi:hypothetical protein
VTVAAIDPVVSDMVFVAELNRLLPFQIPIGQVRRTRNLRVRETRRTGEHDRQSDARLGNVVRSAMKYLCHLCCVFGQKSRCP